MKKTIFMSAAKKARIALAVMAVFGMSFVGAQSAFAENVTVDYNSNIIGAGNPAYVTGRYNVVLGIVTQANGDSNVVIGDSARAEGLASTAVGAGSKAENGGAAVGCHSQATSENSIALGTEAKASATGAVALGALSTADEENTVSIGGIYQEIVGYDPATRDPIYENKSLTRRIVNVADGTKNTDAATFGQIIKAGEYNLTLAADGSGQVTLQTNAGANGPTIKVDASALETQIKENASDITAVDNKIGSMSADGTYIKKDKNVSENLVALDKQVKDNVGAITAVDNKIGSLSADGTYIKKDKNVSENLVELDKQVDKNKQDISNITGNITNVDNKIGDLSADGHYILKSDKVAQNLSALDTNLYNVDNRVGTFTPGSTYNYISAGNNVIDNLIALDKKVAENKATIAGSAFDGSKLNDAIKNVDVAGGYKETATNPNADTKGTVAGAINSAYQAGKEYTDTKVTAVEGKLNTLETKVDKNTSDISNIKTNIGDMSKLDVNGKNNLVDAVNEAYKAATSAGANVGKLDELTTTNKDNLVGAVNEVNKKANDAQTTADNALNKANDAQTTANSALNKANANENKIGALNSLTTTEKGNLVGAVNEVNNKANANEKNIGDLTKLNTTNKGNLVGAVNEVNKKADKNAEDIKTVNGRVDELGGAVSKLDTKVNKVGAGAAALAALHPMEFDSDNKLSFAAGVGNYRGTNAAAIGAFYRPSEQVMFSISGNMGNGENMVNAGVSFALDRPSKTPTTKAALVKTVAAQNEQIAALNETVAEQNEKIARLEAMVEKLAAKQNA